MKRTTYFVLLALLGLLMTSCLGGGGGGGTHFTLTMEIQGQGTVTPEEGKHQIAQGTAVEVTATPTDDWEFSHWEGEVAELNQAETTVVVDKNKTVRAVFDEITIPDNEIRAEITYTGIAPSQPSLGDSVALGMTVLNTGDVAHTFIAGASLWEPGSSFQSSYADFEQEITLAPGEEEGVFWGFEFPTAGDWAYQFGVWKQKPYIAENLLDKQPSPVGILPVDLDTDFAGSLVMIVVGEAQTYSMPWGTTDQLSVLVDGGFEMSETQVTYGFWYTVRLWAEDNGYTFQNPGAEGSEGVPGALPTTAYQEPATHVSWRDAVVWLNALSEAVGKNPVYRTSPTSGSIIRSSLDDNAAVVNAAVQTANDGYRLPTSTEWELAARWKNDTTSTDGSILRGDRWWTPGNYASGATGDYEVPGATGQVAWFRGNTLSDGLKTRDVKGKDPNALGLYDMTGNVWVWTFTADGSDRVYRGGSFANTAQFVVVGYSNSSNPVWNSERFGLRVARDSF